MKTPPFLKDFIDLFFPRLCPVCQRALNRNEENICTTCLHRLPRTGYHLDPLSPMAQLFLGKVPIEKCAAFFFFSTPSDARQLIHHIKYHGGKQCGFTLGKIYANELLPSGFFDDINALVPVPLHPAKLRRRGYNQSEWIARGIEQVTESKSVQNGYTTPKTLNRKPEKISTNAGWTPAPLTKRTQSSIYPTSISC